MPKFNDIIQTFQNGEVSPKLYGRTDSDTYKRSCRTLKNMVAHPQGGVSRRVGTQFVLSELTSTTAVTPISEDARIIPFVVSSTESYLLIFNKLTISSVNTLHVYNQQTGEFFAVVHGSATAAAQPSGEINSIFSDATTLKEIQYAQSGDVLILTHANFTPQVITRTGENTFSWDDYCVYAGVIHGTFGGFSIFGHGFSDPNPKTNLTMTAGATTGSTTLTASSAYFVSTDVGSIIAIQNSGTVGWGYISAYTSTTVVSFNVIDALPAVATSGTSQWIASAWNNTKGFPRSCAFWGGRLFFGGTAAAPDTVWASQVYDIFELTTEDTLNPGATLTADDATKFTLASTKINTIQWMVGGSDLVIGTLGREYAVKSFNIEEVDIRPQTGYGSEYTQPVVVDDVPIYVQRGSRKLREIVYDDRSAGYLSPEVTFFAEHLPRLSQSVYSDAVSPKIQGMCYQALDNNILWAWDNNGYLYATTKSRENSVNAFHRHELGGVSADGNIPRVLSAVSIPSVDGTYDEVFLLVKREINSADVVYLEKIGSDFYEASLNEDVDERRRIPIFMDCAKVFRTHAGANFYASLASSVDADESDGTATGTLTGTSSFSSQRMSLGSNSYIDWDGADNANFAQVGCIEFTLWPEPLGADQVLLTIAEADSDNDNLIELKLLNGTGNLALTIRDSGGSAIINGVTIGDLANFGASYFAPKRISLNYDLDNGQTRVFVNGKQLGGTIGSTGTRDTTIGLIRLGAEYDGTNPVDASLFSDLVIYDSVQHTEDYEVFEYMKKDTTISKLDHLEGEEVTVLGDGNDLGTFTVSSGAITLDSSYDTVVVGLAYTHVLETQSIEAGSGVGSAQGRPTRVDTLAVKFRDTAHCKFGRDGSNQEEIPFRNPSDPIDDPVTLYTGDKVLPFEGSYDTDSRVYLSGDAPLPCNITCLQARGYTND